MNTRITFVLKRLTIKILVTIIQKGKKSENNSRNKN